MNNTTFAVEITEHFKQIHNDNILRDHQLYVVDYLKTHSGVLVQHDLGTGKSLVAAAILADQLNDVIFLSAKTLHKNMQKALDQYAKLRNSQINVNYTFVTMNASNMLEQVKRAVEKDLDTKFTTVGKLNLNNKTLIIDEAHNLFNSITNGSQNAIGLYDAIMRAKSLKVVFLSGTPIVNHPFELVPCYNMLARSEVLPTEWEDFNRFFIDEKNKRVKNKAKFQNRIVGLTSYYGQYYNITKNSEDFPERLPLQIEKIPMSAYQFRLYAVARDIEMRESSSGMSVSSALQKPKGLFTSSYKRLSRQISNIAFPKHAVEFAGKRVTLFHDKVTNDDLSYKNLIKYSPKWVKLMGNINKILKKEKGKHLIYSSFVENAGINMFASVLINNGWEEYKIGGYDDSSSESTLFEYSSDEESTNNYDNITKGGDIIKLKFIRITGDVMPEERSTLIDYFNSENNLLGDEVQLIMISGAGAEGVNLRGVRFIHMMEPYWNWMRMEQVIGRGVRYKSHDDLPKKYQNVQPILYVSAYPKDINKTNKLFKSEHTTDLTLYNKAVTLNEINKNFYKAMAEASVDCSVHNTNPKLNCRLCTPTGEQLYIPDIHKDMQIRSPCKPMEKKEITAQEILVDGAKYAYINDDTGVTIMQFRNELNGYVELARNNPMYGEIYNSITK
jgi:hypothetical protein